MGSSRETLFFWVPVSACLPSTTSYAHCTSVLSLRGLALPVMNYSPVRVGSSDLFWIMTIRSLGSIES